MSNTFYGRTIFVEVLKKILQSLLKGKLKICLCCLAVFSLKKAAESECVMQLTRSDFFPSNNVIDLRNLNVESLECNGNDNYSLIFSDVYHVEHNVEFITSEYEIIKNKALTFSKNQLTSNATVSEISEFLKGKFIDLFFEVNGSFILNDKEILQCDLKKVELSPVSLSVWNERIKVDHMLPLDFLDDDDGFAEKTAVVTASLMGFENYNNYWIDIFFKLEHSTVKYYGYDKPDTEVYFRCRIHIDELRELFRDYLEYDDINSVVKNIDKKFAIDVSYMFDPYSPASALGMLEQIVWIRKLIRMI